ncbi:MAG: transcription-repair coupling factor, partial [Oscillospiraceae bacterium]|nr:transcription-repair coupling factor [Oscillospiraceae bacterium]
MEKLLTFLKSIPEYEMLISAANQKEAAAVTGIGQINRSHLIAGIHSDIKRPIVLICHDDATARRLQEELNAFTSLSPDILPNRELTLYDSAVVSRGWEQKRLRQLFDLIQGKTRIQIFTWEALCQRTIPVQTLKEAVFTLQIGNEYALDRITERLTNLGYSRCPMVEGPGQFSVRGGIVDIFSPAADYPVRVEFFGDELDTMGYFDPNTQRRTENIEQMIILPVGETQPRLHPGGLSGLCDDLRNTIARQRRRKTPNEALIATLEKDIEKYENGLQNPASDRYMSLIYPEFACAMDYIPSDAILVICDQSSLRRTANTRMDDMGLQLDSLLQGGMVAGDFCDYVIQWEDFTRTLPSRTVIYLDAFAGAAYPDDCPPKHLFPITAKQLPGYGGNMDTAASDLAHYQKMEFSTLVLCGSRRRAELLQEMLGSRNISALLCIPLTSMPKPGQILLSDGSLPFGMEYPSAKLAVLTEGQLTAKAAPRKQVKKSATNRQKLNSFTDLSPGDLVVHENYGIGRFVSMEQIKVDGAVKDYIKIAYHGTDTLFVPATQLDL